MRDVRFPIIDMNKYRGEWIAVASGRIIAHGKDLGVVTEKAEKKSRHPVFSKVPDTDILVA